MLLFFQQQTLALKTAHSLFDKVSFIKVHLLLLVSFLLFVTLHQHGPLPHSLPPTPPQPDPKLCHEYTNQLLCSLSRAFSRCFTASPYTNPAVRFDNAEHLPLSPSAKSKRGDLSPPFICNVMSMYSLLVTELEKMVDPTVWENPWGFSGDQGTLS